MRELRIRHRPDLVGVSRDGHTVVVCSEGQVVLLCVDDGAELARTDAVPMLRHRNAITVSNDAAYVLIGQGHHHFERTAHQAVLWDVRAKLCRELEGFAEVRRVDFDPSSRFAIAQSRGPRAGIFDVTTGDRVWRGVEYPLLSREGSHVLIENGAGWVVRRFPLGDDAPVPIAIAEYSYPLGLGSEGSFAVFSSGDQQILIRGDEELLRVRHPRERQLRAWHGGALIATEYLSGATAIEVLDVGDLEARARLVVASEPAVAYALGETAIVAHRGDLIRVWSYDELTGTIDA